MGFRRSEVRILSPRHRKGWRNTELRRPLFFPPEALVGNWIGNPGVSRRVVPKDADGHRQRNWRLDKRAGLSAYPWKRENCSYVRIIPGTGPQRTHGSSKSAKTRHQLGKHPDGVRCRAPGQSYNLLAHALLYSRRNSSGQLRCELPCEGTCAMSPPVRRGGTHRLCTPG